jgi:epoxyqueuosine reductase
MTEESFQLAGRLAFGMRPSITDVSNRVRAAAIEAGFELAGISPVHDFPELDYFPRWVEEGHAADLEYMKARDEEGALKRSSLRRAVPWARSVVVCAINYNAPEPYSITCGDPERGWMSRYAWSREDYHDAVLRRLREVEKNLIESVGRDGDAIRTRCYVDTGPLLERVYAKYAGVGWVGKNTCIISQKQGSWLFLGVILTSLELAPDLPSPDRCGTCTRCIDACPTEAFIAPYQLDSRKCISYLTIEKRGEIAPALRAQMGHHVFGCDICQDVCPWNRKAPATRAQEFQPRPELIKPALEWLATMSTEEFREVFRRSPVKRAKRSGLRRNAVLAMGNSKRSEFLPTLERLTSDEDPVIAEAATWAIEQLRRP